MEIENSTEHNTTKENLFSQSSIYSSDAPLEYPESDRFERYPFSKRIASAISERKNPGSIVTGLYGSFGTGKTTVLNFIQKELSEYPNITILRFNPWQYQNEYQIIKAFFNSFNKAVKSAGYNSPDGDLCKLIDHYCSLLLLGSRKTITSRKQLSNYDIEQVRVKIDQTLRSQSRRLVILIDDIDKLERAHAKAVLKLVKINANFPNTVYVMAFDEHLVSKVLGSSYENDKLKVGERLLEKIVQVSINIPPFNTKELEKFSLECINTVLAENSIQMSHEDYKEFLRSFKNGLSQRIKTARMSKQYGNILSFTLPGVKDDVNLVDFLLIEGLRVFYPAVYETIKNHRRLFLEPPAALDSNISAPGKKSASELLNKALEQFNEEEGEAARYLVSSLFPENKADKDRNISSKQYFDRYFSYFISDKTPFEEELDNLFFMLEYEDAGAIKSEIEKLVKITGAEQLISALKARINTMSEEICISLAISLGTAGECFENPNTLFSFTTIFNHPALLIKELLKRVSDKAKRFSAAKGLLTASQPLAFAFECFRWITQADDEPEEERLFNLVQEEELGNIISGRIAEFAGTKPVYISTPENAPFLLSVWSYLSGKEVTNNYLKRTFEENKGNVVSFLKCYSPANPNEPAGSAELTYGFDQYISMGKIIDPKVVFTALNEASGEEFLLGSSIAESFTKLYKTLNFMHRSKSDDLKPEEIVRKDYSNDSRRKVTIVTKGLYKPIIPN